MVSAFGFCQQYLGVNASERIKSKKVGVCGWMGKLSYVTYLSKLIFMKVNQVVLLPKLNQQ